MGPLWRSSPTTSLLNLGEGHFYRERGRWEHSPINPPGIIRCRSIVFARVQKLTNAADGAADAETAANCTEKCLRMNRTGFPPHENYDDGRTRLS
jgi:hypothetical protein